MRRREDFARFLEAMDIGQPGEAEGLLMKIPAQAMDLDGSTPLMLAAQLGWSDCVRFFLPKSDANQMRQEHRALDFSIHTGDASTIRQLLAATDCTVCNSNGETVLWLASSLMKEAALFEEVLARCDPLKQNNRGETALMQAASNEAKESKVWAPLLRVSDLHVCDALGQDALMHAAMHGNVQLCEDLLRAGANAKRAALDGKTALVFAVRTLNIDCTRLLLPASDPRVLDQKGYSVFDWALKEASHEHEMVEKGLRSTPLEAQWACVDLLSTFTEPEKASAVFEKVGAVGMPRWAAQLERATLERSLFESPQPPIDQGHISENHKLPPSLKEATKAVQTAGLEGRARRM